VDGLAISKASDGADPTSDPTAKVRRIETVESTNQIDEGDEGKLLGVIGRSWELTIEREMKLLLEPDAFSVGESKRLEGRFQRTEAVIRSMHANNIIYTRKKVLAHH
jgi:hypothetical protein